MFTCLLTCGDKPKDITSSIIRRTNARKEGTFQDLNCKDERELLLSRPLLDIFKDYTGENKVNQIRAIIVA